MALELGEFTQDMNEEAFGKYVRNKSRPSAQQLFIQLSTTTVDRPAPVKSAPTTPH